MTESYHVNKNPMQSKMELTKIFQISVLNFPKFQYKNWNVFYETTINLHLFNLEFMRVSDWFFGRSHINHRHCSKVWRLIIEESTQFVPCLLNNSSHVFHKFSSICYDVVSTIICFECSDTVIYDSIGILHSVWNRSIKNRVIIKFSETDWKSSAHMKKK